MSTRNEGAVGDARKRRQETEEQAGAVVTGRGFEPTRPDGAKFHECERCNGEGYMDDDSQCVECGGTGEWFE